ncbi:hypothetical protein NLJ89_g3435 [Agrocybe chaxingu]|uniref:Uncharacterized protein n=1 Tax=Agrocybe chaxingu TaxID=84603 RepID=A0A9W8MYB9_9AGAR|nr:hypothetical protein NLJ89_g3435 [Agrocybe chaxingu]
MSQNPPKTDVNFYKKAERPKHDKGKVSVQIHQPLNASVTWGEESKDVEVTDCPINVAIGNANAVGTPVSALSSAEATPQGDPSIGLQTMRERAAGTLGAAMPRREPPAQKSPVITVLAIVLILQATFIAYLFLDLE